jgi:ABC-type Mn2+/Zn2+ transport system permease subunit
MQWLYEVFSYAFMTRALLGGVLLSLCSALLGVSLVLKRYSMIGDGLSHVGFGALAVAMALGIAPLAVAIPVVVLAALVLLRLQESNVLRGDSAVALIATSSLAVGVTAVSISSGMNTDVLNYMFGSILAMTQSDVWLSVGLCAVVLVLFIVFFNRMFAVTFDEAFAAASGVCVRRYNTLLAVLTAITVVLGMRMMGAMLISSLIVFPALTAMRLCSSYRAVVAAAAIVSVTCFVTGLLLSFAAATPTGASIVLTNLAAFLLSALYARFQAQKKKRWLPAKGEAAHG